MPHEPRASTALTPELPGTVQHRPKTRKAKGQHKPKDMTSLSNLKCPGFALALLYSQALIRRGEAAAVFTFEDVVCQQRRHLLIVIPHGVQD